MNRPFSFFEFRESRFKNAKERFDEFSPLARIFSQVRSLKARSMVVEEIAPNASLDLVQE